MQPCRHSIITYMNSLTQLLVPSSTWGLLLPPRDDHEGDIQELRKKKGVDVLLLSVMRIDTASDYPKTQSNGIML